MNRLDYLFLSKVLINLLFQSGITSITAYNNQNQTIPNKWIYVIISFLLIFLLGYLSSNNSSFYLRFILLVTLSYVNGIIFSGIVKHIPDKEIKELFLQTILIFVTMILVGYFANNWNINIYPLYYFAFLFTIITTVSMIYYTFFDTSIRYKKNLRLGIILLMSVYIILSTYTNLSKDYEHDIIHATLDYYTSLINIFSNLSSYENGGEI